MRAKYLRGHNLKNQTHCKRGHALTPTNIYTFPNGGKCCQTCRVEGKAEWHRKRRFGLTAAQFESLSQSQGDSCAICCAPFSDKRAVVDHDHTCCAEWQTCGRCVRGLLCQRCNVRLSVLEDTDWLVAAKKYLERDDETDD